MSAQTAKSKKKKRQPVTASEQQKQDKPQDALNQQEQGSAAAPPSTDAEQQVELGKTTIDELEHDPQQLNGGMEDANSPADLLGRWLEAQGVSPWIAAEARRKLGSPLLAAMQQLQSLSQLIEAIDRLKIDPSKAANVSLEALAQQANDLVKKLAGGTSIGLKVPVGMRPEEIASYNMQLEALKTNLASLLAARQAMLNAQMEQLVPHLRLVEALTQSPGYVEPETAPGSIVSGQSPLEVQWISLGGIPNPEAVRDDPETWRMQPGLGVEAVYRRALPWLDLPPLQLPTEFPKPPKQSEVSLNLSKKETSGSSKPRLLWNVFDMGDTSTKTFNPLSEEKHRLLETFYDLTKQVSQSGENFRDEWKNTVSRIDTAIYSAPEVQAQQLAVVGGDTGVKLAEDILSAVMEQIPVYSNWREAEDAARQGKINHGSVFYIHGKGGGWFFAEENRDRKGNREVKFHSFEDIANPAWIGNTSQNTYNALGEAWRNFSAMIGKAVRRNPNLVKRYAQLMQLPPNQSNSAFVLLSHLAVGLLKHNGRSALSSNLYGGDDNRLWNNVIHRVVKEKLGASAQQQGTSGQHPWDIK
jgi:hypothetical protein